jgi:organic hydroperoxide reductase OsmC/OhrA
LRSPRSQKAEREIAMATYGRSVEWSRGDAAFTDLRYSRAHDWRFDGGALVRGSSSPHSVRVPWSDPAAVDPEEALVAAVSSCHMLWFLSLAAEAGYVIDRYSDTAQATLGRFADGRRGVTEVVLRPLVVVSRGALDDAALQALHHAAHARCDIGNSLRGEIRVEGSWRRAGAGED